MVPFLWALVGSLFAPIGATAGCHLADRPSIAFSPDERGRIEGGFAAILPDRPAPIGVAPSPCQDDPADTPAREPSPIGALTTGLAPPEADRDRWSTLIRPRPHPPGTPPAGPERPPRR